LRIILILAVVRALVAAFGFCSIHAGHEFCLGGQSAIGKIPLAGRALGRKTHALPEEQEQEHGHAQR